MHRRKLSNLLQEKGPFELSAGESALVAGEALACGGVRRGNFGDARFEGEGFVVVPARNGGLAGRRGRRFSYRALVAARKAEWSMLHCVGAIFRCGLCVGQSPRAMSVVGGR